MGLVLLVIVLLLCVGALPRWHGPDYSYGYTPSIGLGSILVILLVLYLLGVIH